MTIAALEASADDVYIRVVDVGAGLCGGPGTGRPLHGLRRWSLNGQHCAAAVRGLVTGDTIDLMVISHSAADHLAQSAGVEIIEWRRKRP